MGDRVLVIGNGGREHALAWKLASSSRVERVYVAPGREGMADVAQCLDAADERAWLAAAAAHEVDLVVIGPEVPLVDGVADRLRERGHLVFGPSAAAARLEGDKAYAKDFLRSAGIPTPRAERFDDLSAALSYLQTNPGPCVVKATGLAAGKGVTVCDGRADAEAAVRDILAERRFGDAGDSILIEERLSGRELSVFVVVDGRDTAWFAPSRDHKRLGDDDRGPNTGGMGAYTPVADADDGLMARIENEILVPTMKELQRRNLDYRGLLYLGLMLTPQGPSVLEYNCRFGDPETQVVLPTFEGDLYTLLAGAARGELPLRGRLPARGAAVTIVLAAAGYPRSPRKGDRIDGLDDLAEGEIVFHAGTRRGEQGWESAGGRVLNVVGTGNDLAQARAHANRLAERIVFDGVQRRRDIGAGEDLVSRGEG